MATNLTPFERAIPLRIADETPVSVDKLEARLRTLHGGIVLNQYEAGRIVSELRAQFPHGQWGVYLKQMCKRVGMSERAAYYYVEVFEELQGAGSDDLVYAAKDAELNLNKKPHRLALVAAQKEHPDHSPATIAKFAKAALHKNPAVDQLAELRNHFAKNENVQIERVGGSGMTEFQVWIKDVPAKQVPCGQQVTVEMMSDQLRTVEGNVNIGANALTADGVKKFLGSLGVK